MKKVFQFAIMAFAAMTMVACGNNTENKAEGTDSTATEQADGPAVAIGTKGPCTIESEGFSVSIGDGWEVFNIKENEVTVGVENKEQLTFQFDDAANYAQQRLFQMEIEGMKDLGEQKYGENTYATYEWKHKDLDDSDFNAIMKIGDGDGKVIKVSSSNVDIPISEEVQLILGSVQVK